MDMQLDDLSVSSRESSAKKRPSSTPSIQNVPANYLPQEAGPSHALEEIKAHGLGVWQAAFFVLGEVAGSGVLSLPNAMVGTGYIGLVLLIALCIIAGYAGVILGKCWMLMEERFPKYRNDNRQPYQMMGQHCYGAWMRWLVTFCIYGNLLGGSIVYLLLIAGMLQQLFQDIWPTSICYWSMVVALVMVPLSWLGTPKDFWPIAIGASMTILLASLLLTIQSILDKPNLPPPRFPEPTFKSFSLSFGAIVFAYGGAATFPTIQNDMKKRLKFYNSVIIGFIGIMCVYLPLTCAGYFIYGSLVTTNVALTVSAGPLRMTSQILLILHLFCAYVVVINPCFQDIEGHLKMKPGFSIYRCCVRTLVIGFALFIAETVPEFSKILNLVGASCITLLTFVLPVLFYIKLMQSENMGDTPWIKRAIPLHVMTFLIEIAVIGTLGGIASTISAVWDIATPNALSLPCYVTLDPMPTYNS